MVKIRMARGGAKNKPFYSVVVTDSRKRRDSGYIERLGFFNPLARGQEVRLHLEQEKIDYWTSKGAKVSDRVKQLIKEHKDPSVYEKRLAEKTKKAQAIKNAILAKKEAELVAKAKEVELVAKAEEAKTAEKVAEADEPAEVTEKVEAQEVEAKTEDSKEEKVEEAKTEDSKEEKVEEVKTAEKVAEDSTESKVKEEQVKEGKKTPVKQKDDTKDAGEQTSTKGKESE